MTVHTYLPLSHTFYVPSISLLLQALWDFGGKVRAVQQDWSRLREEISQAPKRRR